jgi:SIR2-like domain
MADDDLPLIPPLPEALREAAQLGKLIPFVGAGASRLAGCPNWAEFADGALTFFVERGKFSYAQLAQISGLPPRVKLSLALSLQEEHQLKIDFKSLLHPKDRRNHPNGRRLYGSLSKIGRTFVTTNYDEWLDEELSAPTFSVNRTVDSKTDAVPKPRTVFHRPQDLTAANLNQLDTVLDLHGSLKKWDGMIITTRDYVKHYANDRRLKASDDENPVLTFLEDLFKNKTVLFIGYGLDELEILEYVILKTRNLKAPGLQPRHFILQGFFSHERELMLGFKRYYRECDIELLPFLKDQKGWDQLLDVLDDLANKLPASELAVLQELKEMEGLLDG